MAAPILVAVMSENAANATALNAEKPYSAGTWPNGTICIVRSTRKIYFWSGGAGGGWAPVT